MQFSPEHYNDHDEMWIRDSMTPYEYADYLVKLSNNDDDKPTTTHCFGVHQRANGKWQSRKTGYKVLAVMHVECYA
jgi:hypothetical protein